MSNARLFLNAYNKIDEHLRNVYNFKPHQSFSDIIRQSAHKNIIVRKNENELIDYARLRNAIVHKSIDDSIIAQPNDEVVQKMVAIEKLLTQPPKIFQVFKDKKIVGVEDSFSLKDLIVLTGKMGYSNFPVYNKGVMTGVINPKRIVKAISRVIIENGDICKFLDNSRCGDIIDASDMSEYYSILSKNDSIDKIAQEYENNKKLRAVLVTENGILGEKAVNLLTPSDLAAVNKILEDY